MTYKQIEASREARLWISQVIIPAVTIVGTVLAVPEVRTAVVEKGKQVKESISNKIKKSKFKIVKG